MELRIPTSTPTLPLARVTLRPFRDGDVEGRRVLGRDPEIQRGFGANPSFDSRQPMDESAARSWFERQLGYDGPFVWAVDLDDRLIGECRLHTVDTVDERARYAVGILDRDRLGEGFGTEITRGVLQYAFEDVGFHRIDLRVLASNGRAIGCYEKCGFMVEGREREAAKVGDRRDDDLIMGILRTEFPPAG